LTNGASIHGQLAAGTQLTGVSNNWFANSAGADTYINNGLATQYRQWNGAHSWHTAPSGTAGSAISFTQAMTLDALGNLLVGKTSSNFGVTGAQFINGAGGSSITSDGIDTLGLNRLSSDGTIIGFYRSSSLVGSVSVTTTATSYNTSSDYRLKEITGPITNSGAYIDSLNPVEGIWKADGSTFVGLIAHEAQEASRTPVATGTKDGEQMQAMDYSAPEIIANMIAELKSLRARVAQLEQGT
jgi:hypothetical protein